MLISSSMMSFIIFERNNPIKTYKAYKTKFIYSRMRKTDMRKTDTFSRKYGYLKCVSFKHTTVSSYDSNATYCKK